MRCQICEKRDATIHLTEITNGEKIDMHLCETCAQEQGIAVKSQIPIKELLSNLLAVQPTDEDFADPTDKQTICPNCGITIEQFQKQGVLGCPYDYEVFAKQLEPLIAKAHNNRTVHCGKVPARAPEDIKHQMKRLELKQKLDDAVRVEDYELAARLRDELNQFDGK